MAKKIYHHNNSHIPVLLDDVVRLLSPAEGQTYLDLTAGYGGHASAIIGMTGDPKAATLVDRDENAIRALEQIEALQGTEIIHSDFGSASSMLLEEGRCFDMILVDLGVSSPHLDNPARGFSFMHEGPLDMRMDQSQELTASKVVNEYSERQLARVLKDYGEEPHAKQIARTIIDSRPISSTTELAMIIEEKYGRRGKKHPATRTFQALRIEVNSELKQLKTFLSNAINLLSDGGRLAMISFHSLEDRMVKRMIKSQVELGYESEIQALTKKPISGAINDVNNPRARSAKLRAVAKIKT